MPAPPCAVVVGAGPAGALASIYLARSGFRVEVHDKRARPTAEASKQRTYIMVLSSRATRSIRGAGAVPPDDPRILFLGGTIFNTVTGRAWSTHNADPSMIAITRAGFTAHLISEAERLFPDQVAFHFDSPLVSTDLTSRTATFEPSSSVGTITRSYDLLVGADGARSRVREAMQEQVPGMQVQIAKSASNLLEYKSWHNLVLPKGCDLGGPKEECEAGTRVFFFRPGEGKPVALSTAKRLDGTWSGNMTMKLGEFEHLDSAQAYEKVLRQRLQKLPDNFPREWIPLIAQQCFTTPASQLASICRCSQLTGPSVVLLGDAAHSLTPFLGQGCNSALEDCIYLGEAVAAGAAQAAASPDGQPLDVNAALRLYNARRLPDVKAVQLLEQMYSWAYRSFSVATYGFSFLLTHMWWKFSVINFAIAWKLGHALKLTPTPMFMVSSSHWTYGKMLRRIRATAFATLSLLLGTLALLAAVLLRWRMAA